MSGVLNVYTFTIATQDRKNLMYLNGLEMGYPSRHLKRRLRSVTCYVLIVTP